MASNLEAKIWGVMGASGQGKGVWIKGQLGDLKPARMIIWDFMDEYGDFAKPAASLKAIQNAMIKAGSDGPLCLRYVAKTTKEKDLQQEFGALCHLVYAWGNCVFLAEELSNVTTPSWAPAPWRKMTTSGRHQGIHIIGVAQMPALIDKTFLGNCTLIHCCALREDRHRKTVAGSMDIDPGRISALVKFQYIEKDFETGQVVAGWVEKPTGNAPGRRQPSGSATGAAAPGQEVAKPRKVGARKGAGGRS